MVFYEQKLNFLNLELQFKKKKNYQKKRLLKKSVILCIKANMIKKIKLSCKSCFLAMS